MEQLRVRLCAGGGQVRGFGGGGFEVRAAGEDAKDVARGGRFGGVFGHFVGEVLAGGEVAVVPRGKVVEIWLQVLIDKTPRWIDLAGDLTPAWDSSMDAWTEISIMFMLD